MRQVSMLTKDKKKVLIKLFEEGLSKKLDEIFKKGSPNLYNEIQIGFKKGIYHISNDGSSGKCIPD